MPESLCHGYPTARGERESSGTGGTHCRYAFPTPLSGYMFAYVAVIDPVIRNKHMY